MSLLSQNAILKEYRRQNREEVAKQANGVLAESKYSGDDVTDNAEGAEKEQREEVDWDAFQAVGSSSNPSAASLQRHSPHVLNGAGLNKPLTSSSPSSSSTAVAAEHSLRNGTTAPLGQKNGCAVVAPINTAAPNLNDDEDEFPQIEPQSPSCSGPWGKTTSDMSLDGEHVLQNADFVVSPTTATAEALASVTENTESEQFTIGAGTVSSARLHNRSVPGRHGASHVTAAISSTLYRVDEAAIPTRGTVSPAPSRPGAPPMSLQREVVNLSMLSDVSCSSSSASSPTHMSSRQKLMPASQERGGEVELQNSSSGLALPPPPSVVSERTYNKVIRAKANSPSQVPPLLTKLQAGSLHETGDGEMFSPLSPSEAGRVLGGSFHSSGLPSYGTVSIGGVGRRGSGGVSASSPEPATSMSPVTFYEALLQLKSCNVIREEAQATPQQQSTPPVQHRSHSFFSCCSSSSTVKEDHRRGDVAPSSDRGVILQLKQQPLSLQSALHRRVLLTVYHTLTGSLPWQRCASSVAADSNGDTISFPVSPVLWEKIGFQGANPATDVRATGLLGVLQLLYLVDYYPSLGQHLWRLCLPRREDVGHDNIPDRREGDVPDELPFVLISFQLTAVVLDALEGGLLNSDIQKARAAATASSSPTARQQRNISLASPAAASQAHLQSFPALYVCCECYIGSLQLFCEAWEQRVPSPSRPRIADFGEVKMRLSSQLNRKGAAAVMRAAASRARAQ